MAIGVPKQNAIANTEFLGRDAAAAFRHGVQFTREVGHATRAWQCLACLNESTSPQDDRAINRLALPYALIGLAVLGYILIAISV